MTRGMERVTHTGYTRQLLDEAKRLRARAGVQFPTGTYDAFTVAATPAATYTLTTRPYWVVLLALNGMVLQEGTDYTVVNSTGVVTVDTSLLASGDILVARYLTTGELIASTLTADTGIAIADTFNRTNSTTNPNPASDGGTWTVETSGASPVWGILSNQLYLATGDTAGTRLKNLIRRDLATVTADVAVDFIGLPGGSFLAGMYCSYDPATGNGYLLRWDGGASAATLDRVSGGTTVFNVGATSTLTASSNSRLRMVHDGAGNLTVYQGGVSVTPTPLTDTSGFGLLTGTWVGLYIDPRSSGYSFDNFTAG